MPGSGLGGVGWGGGGGGGDLVCVIKTYFVRKSICDLPLKLHAFTVTGSEGVCHGVWPS